MVISQPRQVVGRRMCLWLGQRFLLGFIQAAARSAADAAAARQDSAMSEDQWWAANGPLLARVFDATKYPTAARVGST